MNAIALDKIRWVLHQWANRYGWAEASPVGYLLRDLQTILDAHVPDDENAITGVQAKAAEGGASS